MYKTISKFSQVELSGQKTLVICDIDKTLLYWEPKDPADFYPMLKEDFPELTQEEIHKEALEWVETYYRIKGKPIPTDLDGFVGMVNKIKHLTDSKLIFLTARNESTSKYTEKNFKDIGLNYTDYQVHYTNNTISKGEFIKSKIDLTGYDQVIFIDDYESYIQTVNDLVPHIVCYKFEIAVC